ncbi:MAG: DUF5828 family protein [Candidatus Aenigmatarchaeota archaeon]
MKPKKVEATNSGVKAEGSWDEICQFLRDFESTTEETEPDKAVEELNRWRPREDEEDGKVVEKTAEEASMKKRGVEEKSNGTKEDLKEAEKNLANSVKVKRGESPQKELKSASEKIARAISVKSIESLRKAEEFIYEKFMIKFNSCYFDTGKFSVNLKREKNGEYSTKINIPDEKLRERTQEEMTGEGNQ